MNKITFIYKEEVVVGSPINTVQNQTINSLLCRDVINVKCVDFETMCLKSFFKKMRISSGPHLTKSLPYISDACKRAIPCARIN